MKSLSLLRCLAIGPCFILALAAHAQDGWTQYTSPSQWISFSHPAGWEVRTTDETRNRYVENIMAQPRGQDFAARRGEMVLRVYEPMYVIEVTRARSTAGSESLFREFLRVVTEGRAPPPVARSYRGRTFWQTRHTADGFEVTHLGFVNEGGYLVAVNLATAVGEGQAREGLLYEIASRVVTPSPRPQLTAPEAAAKRWFDLLKAGNLDALQAHTCARAREFMALTRLAEGLAGTRGMQAALQAGATIDFSGLRYETLGQNAAFSFVRIGGNVVLPDGRAVPFYAHNTLGTNVAEIRFEDGQWRHCDYVRPSARR